MPTSIWRDEVQRLIREEAAVLVEVLPTQEYEDEHIMDATKTQRTCSERLRS